MINRTIGIGLEDLLVESSLPRVGETECSIVNVAFSGTLGATIFPSPPLPEER